MRTIPDTVEPEWVGPARVASLLDRWQCRRDPDEFAALVTLVREPVARVVSWTLRRAGIRDPGACDEAVGLVLERLLSLGHDATPGHRVVFDGSRRGESGDAGWAFVRCVARSRARDVARARRRRDGLIAGYAALAGRDRGGAVDDRDDADASRLRSATEALDERSRQVVGLLLDGKSQTVIAHVLGVSEGTVSRVRARAIAKLRQIFVGADGAEQSPSRYGARRSITSTQSCGDGVRGGRYSPDPAATGPRSDRVPRTGSK